MGIKKTSWGHVNQQEVYLFTLTNGLLEVSITNFGCTVVSVMMKNKKGEKQNLVLGYSSLQGYVEDLYYTGCIVGRFANRIANASFIIDDTTYQLAANESSTGNHLHGGVEGFNKKVFAVVDTMADTVQFHYKSTDEEEGYPGNLDVFVSYQLTAQNSLVIRYKATTDKTTPVNLTNHSYFNLSGTNTSVLQHELLINADKVLVADAAYIPTGEIKPVAGGNLDFRHWRAIGGESFRGLNECFCLDHTKGVAAMLRDPQSQHSMIVRTTLPGLMLYTGDYLDSPFSKNEGLCLETQFFPDSPNQPTFPTAFLHPGDVYEHQTVYQFFDYFIDQSPSA